MKTSVIALVVNVNAAFLIAILAPVAGDAAWIFVLAAVAAVNGAVLAGRRRWLDKADRALKSSAKATNLVLAASSVIVFLGAAEILVRVLVGAGILDPSTAMRTIVGQGEDWRLAHITADKFRESDPVLLWRPVDRWPYTSQRFKGPEVEPEKPPGTLRLLCYGDSNTDGPPRGGWPEKLRDILDESYAQGPEIEVLNAGVAGYTSHQGLLRFRGEVERFRPDLVLVSFGWNDAVTARTADKDYRTPPFVGLERTLLRYSVYRQARRHLRAESPSTEGAVVPRVSRRDYVTNMRGFLQTARRYKARVVFLTRPHVPIPETTSWRGEVEAYNRDLRRFCERTGAPLVDVQAAFATRPGVFVDECHFTPEAHGEMARLLFRGLVDGGLLPAPGSQPPTAVRSR